MLTGVISPYDLSARSAACYAALTLCDHVVTLLPAPHEGTDAASIRAAIEESPRFFQFMESWRWSRALWRSNVLLPSDGADTMLTDVETICGRIEHDDAFAPLRGLVHASVLEETRTYLDVLCRDLMKGGGDPRTSVPVSAAAERFAARRRAILFRPQLPSLAGRIENTSITTICAFSMPILIAASGEHALHLREHLAPELHAIADALEQILAGDLATRTGIPEPMREPLRAYEEAFRAAFDDLTRPRGEDDIRARAILAAFSLGILPADATLRAAAKAAGVLRGRSSRTRARASAGELPTAALGNISTITMTVRETSIRVRD